MRIADVPDRSALNELVASRMQARDDEEEEEGETARVRVPNSARVVNIHVPPSDIDKCIQFSLTRCVVSILSFILVVTDIPRTGLGMRSMSDYFDAVAPDTVMYFGPYAYQVAHINTSIDDEQYAGTCEGERIDAMDLWTYKYDSLSIPTRALAEHLGVSAYPRCVLYLEPCSGNVLSLATTFLMLDELVSALQTRYFPQPSSSELGALQRSSAYAPFQFATRSLWIDRLHHFMFRLFSERQELRIHSAQYFAPSSSQLDTHICDDPAPDSRPLVCAAPIPWMCDHPEHGASVQVPMWEHLAFRLSALKKQHPALDFDLMMITTRMLLRSRQWLLVPSLSYSSDNLEMSTIIRGRNCSQHATVNNSNAPDSCATVFVDDYRYERATVESDASDWSNITGILRAIGQVYMWMRILFLCVGCYKARSAEMKFRSSTWQSKMFHAWLAFAKIPSHVIIYGSWIPIGCYAVAHYIDCAMTHLINDNMWSTANGVVDFDPVQYVIVASIQMRNIWVVTLLLKMSVIGHRFFLEPRAKRWSPRDGITGIRGVLIGAISGLTVFGALRARVFRDSSVVGFEVLPSQIPLMGDVAFGFASLTEYGFRFDVKVLFLSVVTVLLFILGLQAMLLFLVSKPNAAILCRSYYLPHSADTLWSKGSLLIYWRMQLTSKAAQTVARAARSDQPRRVSYPWFPKKISPATSMQPLPQAWLFRIPLVSSLQSIGECQLCCAGLRTQVCRWQIMQGCPNHDNPVDIGLRTKEHWSVVRLKNIAMMTDPVVLLRLYLVGQQLFIYRVKHRSVVSRVRDESRGERTGNRILSPLPDTSFISEPLDEGISQSGPARLYMLPCQLSQVLQCFASDPDYYDDLLARYELIGTTNSSLLPWSLLVNCG